MYVKIIIFLLLLEIIDITYTTTLSTNKLIQDICDTLHTNNSLQLDEDKQWEIICQELFYSKDDDQYIRKQRDIIDAEDIPQNGQMRKAIPRIRGGSSGIRGGSIIRGGTGIRSGSGIRTGSSSSITRFVNTRTGATISRPSGWQWSRSRLVFLPIATRFFHRSSSSSNRFTTPAASSVTYYYCTSGDDPSVEIQCSSIDRDTQCCEEETTQEAFCCGGDVPDYILQDMNRATQTIARIFYTLAALALCMHLFMRRFYR